MRLIRFFGGILVECTIFSIIYLAVSPNIGVFLSWCLAVLFISWILIDCVLKIVVGGSSSIVKYIFSFMQ